MKKIFKVATLIMMLFFATNADAQWRISKIPADELKGTKEHYANIYESSSGYFVCWNDGANLKIVCNEGIFKPTAFSVVCIIGLYEGDRLVKKYNKVHFTLGDNYDTATMFDRFALGQRVIEHLQKKGKVRIIAPRHGKIDFDITIPMNKDIKYDPPQAPLFY